MAVLGLAGVMPSLLGSVATTVVGIAMLFEGAATASRYQGLSALVPVREHEQAQVGGGLTVKLGGGAAGIALGVLALVDDEPTTLLPFASMVVGGAYVVSGGLHPALET